MKDSNPWVLAIRPKTLPAGAGPVLLGLSLAYKESFNLTVALLTLICALLLQISSNLINDYYDGVKGLDGEDRLGPPRATSLGLLLPHQVKKGFLLCLALAFVIGLFLMYRGGTPIILIGLSSLFFAWAYTGGPLPLSYYGLGEVFAFIFFGPVAVWGTWYLQTLSVSPAPSIILWGCAIGVLSSALMGINNLRDRDTDRRKGKGTIATFLGNSSMRKFVFLLLLSAQIIAQYLLYKNTPHHLYHLIGVTPLFFFSKQWWRLLRGVDGRELNITLATVGKYIFLFAIFYSTIILSL